MKTLFPFLFLSAVFHMAALAGFTLILPEQSGVIGAPDGDPDRVFVVMVADQDMVAVAAVPSPVDAPDAKESKPEEDKERQELVEPEPRKTEAPDLVITEQEKPLEKKQDKSTASIPQVASDAKVRRTALGRDVQEFHARLLAAIRQATFFPHQALNENRHGEVSVSFVINRDGTLSSIRVTSSSGSAVLDDAAQDILRRAAKAFPTFPPSVREESLAYNVPIHFKEKRSAGTQRTTATP